MERSRGSSGLRRYGCCQPSLVNLTTSFAFKRTVKLRVPQVSAAHVDGVSMSEKDRAMAKYKSQEPAYKALISELLILRHPSVRRCRNIVDIQAICWEIDEESYEPWPVLIFPKSDSWRLFTDCGIPGPSSQ